MSIITIFFIITVVLVILLIGVGVAAFVDWRAIIVRKFGHNYRHGLAHVKIGDTWVYRESELVFPGDDAMTYSRQELIENVKTLFSDIVPNAIGFSYDEYDGRRVYRMPPGGAVATSDDGEAPQVDYPSELISCHVFDRTASNFASSVNAESEFNWRLVIIGAIAAIAIVSLLFVTGVFKLQSAPAKVTPTTPPPITAPTTTPQSGPVGGR